MAGEFVEYGIRHMYRFSIMSIGNCVRNRRIYYDKDYDDVNIITMQQQSGRKIMYN